MEIDFTISGASDLFAIFETSIPIADAIRSFDLSFISGGVLAATGSLFVDDISAALITTPPTLAGDFNRDGTVDAADYVVWRKSGGTQAGYDIWRANFGTSLGGGFLSNQSVPEPASAVLLILGAAIAIRSGRQSAPPVPET